MKTSPRTGKIIDPASEPNADAISNKSMSNYQENYSRAFEVNFTPQSCGAWGPQALGPSSRFVRPNVCFNG